MGARTWPGQGSWSWGLGHIGQAGRLGLFPCIDRMIEWDLRCAIYAIVR